MCNWINTTLQYRAEVTIKKTNLDVLQTSELINHEDEFQKSMTLYTLLSLVTLESNTIGISKQNFEII